MQGAEPVARVGRDQGLGCLLREQKRKYAGRRSAAYLYRFGVKCLEFLERNCGEIRWRVGGNAFGAFGENMLGDLEKTCSVIWRKRVRRFW